MTFRLRMDGSSADRLGVAELEQKKVSLPYIEQIEYINEQLRYICVLFYVYND